MVVWGSRGLCCDPYFEGLKTCHFSMCFWGPRFSAKPWKKTEVKPPRRSQAELQGRCIEVFFLFLPVEGKHLENDAN